MQVCAVRALMKGEGGMHCGKKCRLRRACKKGWLAGTNLQLEPTSARGEMSGLELLKGDSADLLCQQLSRALLRLPCCAHSDSARGSSLCTAGAELTRAVGLAMPPPS